MALPATDSFVRADGDTLGANWTTITGLVDGDISSNGVVVDNVGSDTGSFWNADVFPNDQYSQLRVLACATATSRMVAAVVRAQSGAQSFYAGGVQGPLGAGAPVEIRKSTAGATAVLTSGTATVNANDTIKLEIIGTALKLYVNGVQVLSTTDGAFSTGSAGLFLFVDTGSQTDAKLDQWEGGAAGGAGPAQVPYQPQYQMAPVMAQ